MDQILDVYVQNPSPGTSRRPGDQLKHPKRAAARKRGKARPRRPTKSTRAAATDIESLFRPPGEAIDNERDRLSQAESILGCLHIAMAYADDDADDVPHYPDLVDMARKLVREAVGRLDSVYRRPVIEKLKKAISGRKAN